jgi:hypothetical protein
VRTDRPRAAGSLQVPLSPVAADRVRWVAVGVTLVGALALLLTSVSGYGVTLAVTLVLALVASWGWPVLSGSVTPDATSVVLALASVAVVLSSLRDDLRWLAAAVALGIVLAFAAQLLRRTGREGLVLTLLSAFGGLAVIASGTSAVVVADAGRGRAVAVLAMAAVAAAVLADAVAAVRAAAPVLGLVALVAASVVAMVVSTRVDEVGLAGAFGIGATVGTVSWSFRRVLALEPAMMTVRGQVGAGAGSVLAVGALVHLFAVFS